LFGLSTNNNALRHGIADLNHEISGLAVDGQSPRRLAQFTESLKLTYPIIAGDMNMARQFAPKGFPTSVLYDPDGKCVMVKEGPIVRQEVEDVLNKRLSH